MKMNNSEILYVYDAKLTNPNGDPDEENRPRMDYDRNINLVSDVRLKRYIRDYLQEKGYDIFVKLVEDHYVTADERVRALEKQESEELLNKWIDVRLFGATMTVEKDNKIFTGPVQFNWGYSLNKVELLESSITSHFSSRKDAKQGTIGKDYRVIFSLLSFFGVISGKRAEKTKLTQEDLTQLDLAMRYAIPQLATRSKIGQYPRLYLRVEYKDDKTYLGDFRNYIKLENTENLRDIKECNLIIDELVSLLQNNKEKIQKIYFFEDDQLSLNYHTQKVNLNEVLAANFSLEKIGE
jgi:CRISPR-associated protein Csh2